MYMIDIVVLVSLKGILDPLLIFTIYNILELGTVSCAYNLI